MCGIVAIVGRDAVTGSPVDGLKRLQYRGYDSSGICPVRGGEFDRRRAPGKLEHLKTEFDADPPRGDVGIAHTRWATHGTPNTQNAHTHIAGPVALVHNGSIENAKPLRDELLADGREILSETNSEVVAHLVAREVERGASPRDALDGVVALPDIDFDLSAVNRVTIVACGISFTPAWSPNTGSKSSPACPSTSMCRANSATANRCWSRAGWRCSSARAGETADTLAALRHARSEGRSRRTFITKLTR